MPEQIIEEAYPLFQKTTLSNGVRVITESIPSVRSVAVGVWIAAGSRDERAKEAGISHFIEHMVFKGTRRRRMHHIARRLEAVGGYLNAFTSKEYTCFYARALDEHLERSIDTVADLIVEPAFPEKELVKEKEVVLEEMKMYDDAPEDLVFDHFEGLIYKNHALGRPILGYPETVKSFSREQLFEYIGKQYTPDRIVLSVAGKADHDKVVAMAEKAFAQADRVPQKRRRSPVNGYDASKVVEPRPIQQAHFVLGTRSVDVHHPLRSAVTVLNTILGGGMSSRLNQNIREKYGYCYNIYSFVNLHSDTGDFGVYMGTDASKVNRSEKLILRELEKLADNPVSPRTLSQAKNQVKGSIMLGLESMSNRMMRLGRQELIFERYFSLDEVLDELDSVTIEAVQEAAQTLFVPERFSTVVLVPKTSEG
ncbi:MAG TPA: pitrilysin family protein [Rhodothermales bacterium]|nr:pitrilysin family protein [Rhodothermales bacterium]